MVKGFIYKVINWILGDKKDEFVRDSETYQNLQDNHSKIQGEQIRLSKRLKRRRKSFQLAKSVARDSQERAKSLEKQLQEGESPRKLGEHMLSDSVTGVLAFDEDNIITEANETLCRYIGIEESELVGERLEKVRTVSHYFNLYSSFIGLVARDVSEKQDSEIKPNRFKIDGIVFDVMGYSDDKGGRIVLKPLEERGIVEKLFGSRAIRISPETPLTRENIVDEVILPLMDYHTSYRYLSLENSSMNESAMERLAELYGVVTHDARGEKERYAIVFQRVSEKERDYLIKLGVDEKHIKGIRPEPEEDIENVLVPQPNPVNP